jgi:hypothetical protein
MSDLDAEGQRARLDAIIFAFGNQAFTGIRVREGPKMAKPPRGSGSQKWALADEAYL